MRSKSIIFYSLFLLCFSLALGHILTSPAYAQVSPSIINVAMLPATPAPNENVKITLSSFSANLDIVSISWIVDGKNVMSGIGQKSFSLTTGAVGSKTEVIARIYLPEGQIDRVITISPGIMVLLWQAEDSYVPPFYKGKALLPREGTVKVVALPETRTSSGTLNPRNMTYSWQKNYNNVANLSGYGKNFFTFDTDYLDNSNNVSVTASTPDQSNSSTANIQIIPSAPQISFYRMDSRFGISWDRALSNSHNVQNNEIVVAIPYFISIKEFGYPGLIFRWFINDLIVSIPDYQKNIMPIAVQPGSRGTSKLKLEVENSDKLFEKVSREINVNF